MHPIEVPRSRLERLVVRHHGNRAAISRASGYSLNTIRRLLRLHGLEQRADELALAARRSGPRRRAEAEQAAVSLFSSTMQGVGVDALVEHAALDRSGLYSQARGTRPPQLSAFIAAVRFDPEFGRAALSQLAGEIGCVLVERARGAVEKSPRVRGNLRALLVELEAELEGAGLLPEGDDDEEPLAAAG